VKIFIVILCIFSFRYSFAQVEVNPLNTYPSVLTFQSILFQQLKNYFELLKSKSIIFEFEDNRKVFRYTEPTTNMPKELRVKIERLYSDKKISERVIYSLENGEVFSWDYVRRGDALTPTGDSDLMTLKMKPSLKEESFSITLPEVKQSILFEKTANVEISYALIGSFEFNVKIEKWYRDNQPQKINYLLFFAQMPNPQTFLTVMSSQDFALTHVGKNGVITPKEFFNGINETTGAFFGASQESNAILLLKGFPKF
jgi:hypothetical protein